MVKIIGKLFGSAEERVSKRFRPFVDRVNALESDMGQLTDAELRSKTDEFRTRMNDGATEDDLIPEAFATVREAAKRTLKQRHFDVQVTGGLVLNQGNIAEMKTGEGKTLVATLPAYLNAVSGRGVHIVTVNDYLARRDPVWMGPVYHSLGLSVSSLQHESSYLYDPSSKNNDPSFKQLRSVSRKEAYQSDITYGTNNEYGFDYLRDNMSLESTQQVQRPLNYAIVDEVDNILVDEARTPLIISGPAQDPIQLYYTMAQLAPKLIFDEDYFLVDERSRALTLGESGVVKLENLLSLDNLYSPDNFHVIQYIENALKAHHLFKRDKEYVVKNREIIIVDEFTGRLQPGRRWSDGLHQAIEAKEGLKVQRESITYATITLQNYFRMYKKLSGMTGTAATESEEFLKIYRLDVIAVPTNVPMGREDHSDLIFMSEAAKWNAVSGDIEQLHAQRKPVLVGTTSIENSEHLSGMLRKRGIRHEVLNAKQHEREAQIIAQAGSPGAVTVATNMAGRGTDIILGGSPEISKDWKSDNQFVLEQGGLTVIGTEHHEARRIDNQLRGRSGRQGDPGTTRFYASMEDEVVKRFGGERAQSVMSKVSSWTGLDKDAPLESGMITKIISSAQNRVEGYHFESRKNLLEFDDVLNRQREEIYRQRQDILDGTDLKSAVIQLVHQEIDALIHGYLGPRELDEWNLRDFLGEVRQIFQLPPGLETEGTADNLSAEEIKKELFNHSNQLYENREIEVGSESMRTLERLVMLRSMDLHWVQHLTAMERLRQGVGLQAFGQRSPLVMYQNEGRRMYDQLLHNIRRDVVHSMYSAGFSRTPDPETSEPGSKNGSRNNGKSVKPQGSPMAVMSRTEPITASAKKIGRNDPCHCGSGTKYKRCHGRV